MALAEPHQVIPRNYLRNHESQGRPRGWPTAYDSESRLE